MIAGLAIVWYVPVNMVSENFLFDTITALSLMIAFYYALTGLACVVYYRRELTKSVKNFLFIGVGPLVGAAILGYLFVKSSIDFSDPENSYTGQTMLGMGVPFVIGMGFLLLGLVLLVLWRLGGNERFFGRRAFEAVDPAIAGARPNRLRPGAGSEPHDRRRRRRLRLLGLRGRARDRARVRSRRHPGRRVRGRAAAPQRRRRVARGAAARSRSSGGRWWTPRSRARREAGVTAEPVLVPKRPAEALLALAAERDARMIVVGSASERPLTGIILGSVPHKLLHRSTVPVLVVPMPD